MHDRFALNMSSASSVLRCFACCIGLACTAVTVSAETVQYGDLTPQQQADLSRFLGWVWGDGKPLNTDRVTGIRSGVRHPKYNAVVERLLAVPGLGLQLGMIDGAPSKLKIKAPWDFWNSSLPGGNPGDPQLLRDAIRNPNFLAGVIEGEGDRNTKDEHYYIDDHFHGPHRTDKQYGLAHFGPERVLQLFELLGETYGFTKTTLRIGGGTDSPLYTYAQINEARSDLRQRFNAAKAHNQTVNESGSGIYQKLIPTHVYIHRDDWDTLRSYGFFFSGRIPESPTGTPHRSVADGTLPANDLPPATGTMSFFAAIKSSNATVLEADMQHLRSGEDREWSTFPEQADAKSLRAVFNFRPKTAFTSESEENKQPFTLQFKQFDVKQRWDVLLNDEVLGQLVRHEEPLISQLEFASSQLREGQNVLSIVAQDDQPSDDIRVGEINLFLSAIRSLHTSKLSVRVVDDNQQLVPARITITDQEGNLVPVSIPESSLQLAAREGVVYTASGVADFSVAPGSYMLYASRGFEYSMDRIAIAVGAKETNVNNQNEYELQIRRSVDTTGWVACDTHVHTFTHSRHGDASMQERMVTLVGEAVEFPIATDHNRHIDYRDAMKRTGTQGQFTPVIGNEVTTKVGHFNVFPVASSDVPTPNHKTRDWDTLFSSIFSTPDVSVAIINHARDVHGGFRPFDPKHHLSISGENLDGWELKANAMELLNSGATQTDPLGLFTDWCGWINHGKRITPVGSSDSHHVSQFIVGQGRTYIRCNDSDPGNIDVKAAVAAFKKGKVVVSYGLFADVRVDDTIGPGDLVAARETINVDVTIKGPAWANVKKIQLFVNGTAVQHLDVNNQKAIAAGVLAKQTFELKTQTLKGDGWFSVVATGDGIASPHWRTAKPYLPDSPVFDGHTFSCTGPIWIDVDGNGYQSPAEQAKQIVADSRNHNELATALARVSPAVVVQTLAIVRSLESGAELRLSLFNKEFTDFTDKLPGIQRKTAFRYRDELRKSVIAQSE